jgi:PAS domain-containing protein
MSPFYYERISAPFIQQLAEKVLAAESTVLIGPRYNGKRHVLSLLRSLLEEQQLGPIVDLRFLENAPLHTDKLVHALICNAIAAAAPNVSLGRLKAADDLTAPIEKLAAKLENPVILLASNVDAMTHHLARAFLQGVRTLVEENHLIAVMSGEHDFHELVYGPKSEFNCANQFVIQGYAEGEFRKGLTQYLRNFQIRFDSDDNMSRHLWELTGGNFFILRIVLWLVLEARSNNNVPVDKPLTIEEVPRSFKQGSPTIYGAHIFRHARQLIDREPICWNDLETLIKGQPVEIGAQENTPSHLELAGVAVRVFGDGGAQQLRTASPIMHEFIEQGYDDRHFGDLYAGINDWNTAFERYDKLCPDERIRPSSSDDRNEVDATVNSLCSFLYLEATHASDVAGRSTIDKIKRGFAKGCHYILGFREVTFWYRDTWQNVGWEYFSLDLFNVSDETLERIAGILPIDNKLTPGHLPLRGVWNRYAVAAILPTLSPDQQAAVVVGDFEKSPSISREREILIKRLLNHFVKAYTHAVAVTEMEVRSRVRGKQIDIINDIFNSLRGHEISVQHIIRMAARGLRQLNYRRALFSLVDPEKQMIEGVLDDCEEPLVSVADLIRYPLSEATNSLQSFVINTKTERTENDALHSKFADQKVVRAGNMKAFAIIPILNPANEAIGTILVERRGNAIPSNEEIKDLKIFGQQLAIAIEQCQRVNLLESGLDKIPDPIFIVDRTKQPRYANKAASDLLGIPIGWQEQSDRVGPLTRQQAGQIVDIINESLSSGNRLASHIEIGHNPRYHWAVVSSVIKDWRDKTIGGLLRMQDLTYLYKVFGSSRRIAEANDTSAALSYMLEAAKLLDHKWGRLYLARTGEDGVQRFVSKLCFGYEDKSLEEAFLEGRVILEPNDEKGHNDWLCIERGEPVVFCWKEESENGKQFITSHGLRAINWKSPQQPEATRKNPGDFWIDFPLMTGPENVLGKICLQCDEDLKPENFVYLKVLSETFAQLLDTFLKIGEEKLMISVAVADRIMATQAHNIGTRLASLPVVLAKYLKFEKKMGELHGTNQQFKYILDQTLNTIKRTTDLLKPLNPEVLTVDLASQIETTLSAALPANTWEFQCSERPLEAQVDSHLLETALLEMIQNSRDIAPNPAEVKIHITLESKRVSTRDVVIITYRDNGPGVPPDLTKLIFEDFFSQRPGRRIGTGLGLGFVRRVVAAHAGEIFCNALNGRGAEFIITIPKQRESKERSNVSHSNSRG